MRALTRAIVVADFQPVPSTPRVAIAECAIRLRPGGCTAITRGGAGAALILRFCRHIAHT
jgi:hypothetical protein